MIGIRHRAEAHFKIGWVDSVQFARCPRNRSGKRRPEGTACISDNAWRRNSGKANLENIRAKNAGKGYQVLFALALVPSEGPVVRILHPLTVSGGAATTAQPESPSRSAEI